MTGRLTADVLSVVSETGLLNFRPKWTPRSSLRGFGRADFSQSRVDISYDKSNESREKFTIPFMHEICANRILASNDIPVTFELGKNGHLVGISRNEQDYTYSFHGNFADYSRLQYSPAFLEFTSY